MSTMNTAPAPPAAVATTSELSTPEVASYSEGEAPPSEEAAATLPATCSFSENTPKSSKIKSNKSTNKTKKSKSKSSFASNTSKQQKQKKSHNSSASSSYWDSIKSRLLSTNPSTRLDALQILEELLHPSCKGEGGGDGNNDRIAAAFAPHSPSSNERSSTTSSNEQSALLSTLLPALAKLLVSPRGKASLMLKQNSSAGNGKDSNNRCRSFVGSDESVGVKRDATEAKAVACGGEGKKLKNRDAASIEDCNKEDINKKNAGSSNNIISASLPNNNADKQQPPTKQTKSSSTKLPSTAHEASCYVSPSASTASLGSTSTSTTNNQLRHTSLLLLDRLSNLIICSGTKPPPPLHNSIGTITNNNSNSSNNHDVFRRHAPFMLSIVIHVLIDDYEDNSLLASAVLQKILKEYKRLSIRDGSSENPINSTKSSSGGGGNGGGVAGKESKDKERFWAGGKEGARMFRECQMLLDFAKGCYTSLGQNGNLRECFEFCGIGDGGANGDVGDGIDGGSREDRERDKATALTTKAVTSSGLATKEAAKSAMPITPTLTSSNNRTFSPSFSTSNTAQPTPANNATAVNPTPSSSHLASNKSLCLLAQFPPIIQLLFQLHATNQRFVKNNISALVPEMMEFMKVVPSMGNNKVGGQKARGTPVVDLKSSNASFQKGVLDCDTPVTMADNTNKKGAVPHTPSLSTPKLAVLPMGVKFKEGNLTPGPIQTPEGSLPSTTPFRSPSPSNRHHQQQIQQQRYHCMQASHLLSAQSQTLSFISSFLVHTFGELMKVFEEDLAICVLQLLRNCPREAIQARTEILISTRQIFATDFRTSFYRHVDTMLDERLLIGSVSSRSSSSNRRGLGHGIDNSNNSNSNVNSLVPLGYSILANLLHHIRPHLTPAQTSRIIRLFSRALHDVSVPPSLQISAVKLLVSLTDMVFRNNDPDPQVGRDLLVRILRTLVDKLEVLQVTVKRLMEAVSGTPKEDSSPSSLLLGSVLDTQLLLRPMIHGMKTIFWCISSYSHQREKERHRFQEYPSPQFNNLLEQRDKSNEEVNSATLKMTRGERELVMQFARVGLPCLRIFSINVQERERALLQRLEEAPFLVENSSAHSKSSTHKKRRTNHHHREILEMFAVSFTSLESYNFRKVMAPNLHCFWLEMSKPDNIHGEDATSSSSNDVIFSHLLLTTGKAVSYEFCEVLMRYLMGEDVISQLGEVEIVTSNPEEEKLPSWKRPLPTPTRHARNLSRIFSLALSSLLKYPRNEAAFLPHLQLLAKECVQRSTEGSGVFGAGPYLNLLRSLFRTLSSGKFEHSYKEINPLVPTLLNNFYRIYTATSSSHQSTHQHVLLELCLTIPSRLSTLLPHLPLLLKIILPALRSSQGDLINLGLRTLEFWVDNLHPSEYLFPILSADSGQLVELMRALMGHLKPAPYPFGLLCMRLMGKMGGVNRLFMAEFGSLEEDLAKKRKRIGKGLAMICEWQDSLGEKEMLSTGSPPRKDDMSASYLLPFPLACALEVLQCVAAAPYIVAGGSSGSKPPSENSNANTSKTSSTSSDFYRCNNFNSLLSVDMRKFNLNSFCMKRMEETKCTQSKSAFVVLKAALAAVLDLGQEEKDRKDGQSKRRISICIGDKRASGSKNENNTQEGVAITLSPQQCQIYNDDFKLICDGLFAATVHEDLHEEAMLLLRGLSAHIFYFIVSNRANIIKMDCDGCTIDPLHEECGTVSGFDGAQFDLNNHIVDGKLQPLKPFGRFRMAGPLENKEKMIDPFVFNESLSGAFTNAYVENSHYAATTVMYHVIEVFHTVKAGAVVSTEKSTRKEQSTKDLETITNWGGVLFENLLSKLCQSCFCQTWNVRSGAMAGLFKLITKMGQVWSQQYEVEILHCALFCVKDTPEGIFQASEESMRFFLQVSWFFFGGPTSWEEKGELGGDCPLIHDVLCPTMDEKQLSAVEKTMVVPSVKKASLTLILSEIASTKPLVRFAVRHVLRQITRDSAMYALLFDHLNSLKRLLFPKLLRTLPLPNQCAAVDACAFILDRAPKLIPITDQNLLAFLSELLKMVSIADGEFSDASFGSIVLIDKNGFAVNNGAQAISQDKPPAVRASSLFLRKSIVVANESFGGRIEIPAELPIGVQLRVSTLLLFRGLIRGFPDEFYDAPPQSKIGNIRPHVVALLFRSLISEPAEIVSASGSALHNALILCKGRTGDPPSKGHRLPKELIQSCIRPILLDLREYTKLSIPLLRGLSRLLSLLSSWFNKTLGEKLIEHLNRFTEPDKIVELQVWKPGDEPIIAAAVMDLFSVLPQASHFVEVLVKQTIRLEAVLPRYKPCHDISPFRGPLARYLNRHSTSAISFFLDDHRLCNPVYSSLFQDLLKRDDTALLRKIVSGSSVTLLNVCFERPLAIIRSEKISTPGGKAISSSLTVYGIDEHKSPSFQRKLEGGRQNIETKKKLLALKTQEEAKSQKAFQCKTDDLKLSEHQAHAQAAREAMDHAKAELDDARHNYVALLSQASSQNESDTVTRRMTVSALELQHQGFKIVEILASLDSMYLANQNEIVRALRWLWRSRGRHYRLLHEEELPPRYHCESLLLGQFLVSYSQANEHDTDVLFDLIRIFLQPLSSIDFSFIQQYLLKTVSTKPVEQQNQILQRFSTLIGSETSEETKILSAQLLAIPLLKQSTPGAMFKDMSATMLLESFLKDGVSTFGPKLTCEMLQIVDILLERSPDEMANFRKDLLKYIWGILKCNDSITKYHAYLTVSRFIATFDTPSKVVQQVYRSLLRDTSESTTIYAAMDVLLPALKNEDLEVALDYTTNMIQDVIQERDSISQMTHLWKLITRYPQIYICHKSAIMPYLLESFSLLGQQPNASPEARDLLTTLAQLIVDWADIACSDQVTGTKTAGLDQNTIDTVLNVLIEILVANAKGKQKELQQCRQNQIMSLITSIVSSRKKCKLDSFHFENALSHGGPNPTSKDDEYDKSAQKEISDSKSRCDAGILALCAEIVLILLRCDPENDFIGTKVCYLLNRYMANIALSESRKLGKVLEDVLFHLLSDRHANRKMDSHIVIILEGILRENSCHDQGCSADFALKVIERIWETNQDFIEPLLGSLTVFARGKANEHIKQAKDSRATSNASSMQQMSENAHWHQLSATPTVGMFVAACGLRCEPPCQTSNSSFKNQIVIENQTLSASLNSLITSMRLVGSSGCLFTSFSSTRETFTKIISDILESSNSLPVVVQAVSTIGKWLTVDVQQTPLTMSERQGFLCQLALLDFQRFPEVSSQTLRDIISCIVLSAYRNCTTISKHLKQLFVSCLLSANPHVRLSAIKSGCNEGDFAEAFDSPYKPLHDTFRQVLQANFEGLGKQLWTTVIVDVLLASSKQTGGVHLGHVRPNHQIFASDTHRKGMHPHPGCLRLNSDGEEPFHTDCDGIYDSFTKVLLQSKGLCGRGKCIAAIGNLVHSDVNTCQSMLEIIFQAAWQHLPDNNTRTSLIKPLSRLLSQPFHSQFLQARRGSEINAVQSMLRLLVHLRPIPVIDPFLLHFLGKNYNAESETLFLLESQYIALKTNGCAVDSYSLRLITAIQNSYDSLGDRDVSISISSVISTLPGTKFALSLDLYDLVNESASAYLSLIDRADGEHVDVLPSENEIELWQKRWVEAHKELSDWVLIDEVASSTGNTDLMLECAWKTNNWEKVKSLMRLPSVVASLETGDSLTKMTEIMLAIHDGNLAKVENLHAQTAQLCLYQWQLLPSVLGSNRNGIIQFQRLVELRETSQIMVETSAHAARRTIPDLKLLLGSWRHRLCNSFERISEWDDIFLWRFQIFDAISSKFAWADPSTVTTLHDRPFGCITRGRTARKQGLKEVAAFSLNSLTDCTIDVEYAFLKLREQVVSFQHSSMESLKGGLDLVNSTNLSFFDSRQKAEMFRLKAYFLSALNEKPKSNQAYCHAVQICPTYARAWIDWGLLCASLSDETRHPSSEERAEINESTKKTCLYLVQAMGCFLEAVRCDSSEQSRDHIPYCLSMLANDGPGYGNLCRTFETRSAVLPSWVWLPWIPQLLSSLCRVEGRAMKSIIIGILKDHPQALYYSLRSFYLERRDIVRSKTQRTSSLNDDDASSSRLAEEFMSNLRKVHSVLWLKLEQIIEDLIVRFRPSYEAELLHSIIALLQKMATISRQKTEATSQIDACMKSLVMLGMKFFHFNRQRTENFKMSRKSARFHSKYAALFKKDFLESDAPGPSGEALVNVLQKWKTMLEIGISRVPDKSMLQEVSPSLSWFSSQAPDLWAGACESKSLTTSNSQQDASFDNALYKAKRSSALAAAKTNSRAVLAAANSEGLGGHTGGGAAVVEIPGQYAPTSPSVLDSRPVPELHIKLMKFDQCLELTTTSTKQHVHRITMIGNDGNTYRFLLQLAIPYWIRTDERSAQVQYVMRKALRRDSRSCRRCLTSRPSVIIPVAQRMRMTATETSHQSLDSVFRYVQGPTCNRLIPYFQEKVASKISDLGHVPEDKSNQAMKDAKLEVYHDICHRIVLPNIISTYMITMIPSTEHLFQFRHTFASQLAANSLLQYAFAVVERTPTRFVFCHATGRILLQDFRSQYNHGLLEKHDVPFRMTRNITEFIGPFMLDGVFIPSFTCISSALQSKRRILEPILCLLLRDDAMSWYISKSSTKTDQKMQEVERQLADRVQSNVRFVQERLGECSPREVVDAAAEAIGPLPTPIDIKVRSLVDAASSAEKLSMMPPAYQPWL